MIFGARASVRLPSRIVPICVNEPIGRASPFRIAITPAMVVVLTAPRPTSSTPSLPRAGAISIGGVTLGHYIMGKMRRFLRKSSVGAEPLAVTMSGVRLGERALQIGLSTTPHRRRNRGQDRHDGRAATLVVATDAAAASARSAIADAGGLGDVLVVGQLHPLPLADDAHDVVVLHTARGLLASLPSTFEHGSWPSPGASCVGGRLIALEAGAPTGLRGLLGGAKRDASYDAAGEPSPSWRPRAFA